MTPPVPWTHHLRAAAVLFTFWATALLATPGIDQLTAGTLKPGSSARAEALKEPFGWWEVGLADANRAVRLPFVRLVEPLQRPLRIAQAWSLYGGGPSKVKRLEVVVDGVLRHRSKDPEHAWLASTLRFRKIRPIVSAVCGERSKNTDQMMKFLASRARRDFADVQEVVVQCTAVKWPGTGEPEVLFRYRLTAPAWEVQK